MTVDNLRLIETTPPASEPVSVSDAKAHLRVTHDAEDASISALITAARQMCEQFTGRAFINRTLKLYLDQWPSRHDDRWWDGVVDGVDIDEATHVLFLPKAPLQTVTAIRTYDNAGNPTVFAASNYLVDAVSQPARIVLTDAAAVPSPQRKINGIEIEFVAGYGASASSVPQALRQAVLQLTAYLFENRGDVAAHGLQASGAAHLLQPYKVYAMGAV